MIAALPAVVINAAVDQYLLHGYALSYPTVEVVAANDAFMAEALPGRILVASDAAAGMAVFARVIAKPTARLRARAYRACGLPCVTAVQVALHEVAHLVQYQYGGITSADRRIEGLADAVAADLHPALIRRVIGQAPRFDCAGVTRPDNPNGKPSPAPKRCTWLWYPELTYPGWVSVQRLASAAATGQVWMSTAARTWRIEQLAVAS